MEASHLLLDEVLERPRVHPEEHVRRVLGDHLREGRGRSEKAGERREKAGEGEGRFEDLATTFSSLPKSSAALSYTTSSDSTLRSGMSRNTLYTLCLPRPPRELPSASFGASSK